MLQHTRLALETRPQATAHLAQTMSFLQLPMGDLEAALLKEVEKNPALEHVDELRCPNCGRKLIQLPCSNCATPHGDSTPVVYLAPRQASGGLADRADGESEDAFPDLRCPDRLDEYILGQIGALLTYAERPVAAYVLARLDDDGLLPESPAEVAVFVHASLETVGHVLTLIQHADPPGVGACSPRESLLVQLETLADGAPEHIISVARAVIQGHFESLARNEYGHIARQLGLARRTVEQASQFIQRNLTPYPARAFWGDGKLPNAADQSVYHRPDISISLLNQMAGGPLMVEVFSPLRGWLRVNPEIKAALGVCGDEDRGKWTELVERAALVTKCLQQRNNTMRRLMEIIAQEQREFILGGDRDLRPLTRAQIAKALGVHESTISRAVAGKAVALPNGRIIPLSKVFDRSLSVRDRVRDIVQGESRPLTDDQIAATLARDGVVVARRTVAKYRNMLGILPANIRARQLGTPQAAR
jgi:RNA polymerase sigma-54 factor